MLERYSTPEMRAIWSDEAKLARWVAVELAVLDARVDAGEASPSVADGARAVEVPRVEEVLRVEAETRHDVVAFLDVWCSQMSDEAQRWVHRGLTSSDVVDSATGMAVRDASQILITRAKNLMTALARHPLENWDVIRVGRTHGVHAVPTTWGHRVADFALAIERSVDRLVEASQMASVVKISGPIGRYTHVSPGIEKAAAISLGLQVADIATQVIMRDRLAVWVFELSAISTICEGFALEIRHGHRTEVGELVESRDSLQVGSSSMPHKDAAQAKPN
ncbi:lyase family protein [Amycolatopsis sp. NPDC003731]